MPDLSVVGIVLFAFFMDVNTVNQAFGLIIPAYTLLAVLLLGLFLKFQPLDEESLETPVYRWEKPGSAPIASKTVTPWKRKFFATWEATGKDRTGLYEFMIFNGAPSFMASMRSNSAWCNIISMKDGDENVVQVTTSGFPAAVGGFVPVAESKEATVILKGQRDPQGALYDAIAWWGTEGPLGEKSLTQQWTYVEVAKIAVIKRWVTAEGRLGHNSTFDYVGKGQIGYSTLFTKKS